MPWRIALAEIAADHKVYEQINKNCSENTYIFSLVQARQVESGHPTRDGVKSPSYAYPSKAPVDPRVPRPQTGRARLLHKCVALARPGAEERRLDTVYEERRVLIVEDEERLRCYLAMSLEGDGVLVEQAGSLAEARVLLARLRFDAVVLDVGLPDGDGLTLLERSPADRALVITANPDPARFAKVGVLHHLTKPLDLPEFVREVHSLTGGRLKK